jgi:hypothetical protein
MAKAKSEVPEEDGKAAATIVDETARYEELTKRLDQLDTAVGTALEGMQKSIDAVNEKLDGQLAALKAGSGTPASGVTVEMFTGLREELERVEKTAQTALDKHDPMRSTIGPRGT